MFAVDESEVEHALDRARAGHQDGYKRLWDAYSTRVAGFVRGRGIDADADDVCNQVFLEVFSRLDRFDGSSDAFLAHLPTVARRRSVDAHRDATRRRRFSGGGKDDRTLGSGLQPSAEDEAMHREAQRRARELLGVLPVDQRDVLMLRVFGDLTVESIAGILGRSPGAVKQLQRRALQRLRQQDRLTLFLDAVGRVPEITGRCSDDRV